MTKGKFSTRDVVLIGVSAALVVLCTMFLKIQGPTGMIHFGSAAIFTVAALFGGVYGAVAGAIGSLIFDILGGQFTYTIWSFFIKGVAGLVVGLIARGYYPKLSNAEKPVLLRVFFAALTGMVINAIGYFFAWWQVIGDIRTAFINIFMYSVPTSAIGIITACLLVVPLSKALEKSGFYKN